MKSYPHLVRLLAAGLTAVVFATIVLVGGLAVVGGVVLLGAFR